MPTIKPTASKPTRSPRSPAPSAPPRSKKRWLLLFFLAAMLLFPLALVAAAPWLLTSSAVLNRVLAWGTADLHGSVAVGSVSVGWFSPCSAKEIVLADTAGKTVVHIPSAGSEKTLLSLLLNLHDLGKFHVDGPEVQLVLREGGSNLEDMFAAWLETQQQTESRGIEIDVTDATIAIQDRTNDEQCLLTRLSLKALSPPNSQGALGVEILAMVNQAGNSGPLALSISSLRLQKPLPGMTTSGVLALRADFIPLGIVQSLACRLSPGTRLAGIARTQWNVQWGLNEKGQPRRTLAGRTEARGLSVGGPWIGGDSFEFTQVEFPCQIACEAGHLELQQTGVTCDLGQVTCQASLSVPDELATLTTPAVALAALRTGSFDVTGNVDLSRLAQMLPKFLQIRHDVQFRSGEIAWHVRNSADGGATTWNAQVDASRLVAVCQGHEVSCEKPLHAVVNARQDDHGLTIQNVEASADFFDLQGKDTPNSFQMSGTCDLGRLASEAGKFVNLDGLTLGGQATCKLQAGKTPDGAFDAAGHLQLNQFQLTSAGNESWTEEQLTIATELAGRLDGASLQELSKAQLEVVAGQERLAVTLKQPIAKIAPSTAYPLAIELVGEASNWLKRAQPFSTVLASWQAEGQITAQAAASYSLEEWKLESSQLDVQPLRLRGQGLNMNDEQCRISASGQSSARTGRIDVTDFTLRTNSLAIEVTKGSLDRARPLASVTGQVAIAGDVARLQSWLIDPSQPPTWQMTGQLKCQALVQPAAGRTSAQFETTIENLLATSQSGSTWREPAVRITAQAFYDAPTDTLSAEQLDCVSNLIELQAKAKIAGIATQRQLECQGQVKYDLAKLSVLLSPYVNGNVTLTGQESRSFSFSGPLVPMADPPGGPNSQPTAPAPELAQLSGRGDVGWESANVFGFLFGPGVAKTEMTGGMLHLLPVDLPVNQGRIHLEVQVPIVGGPLLATVAQGTLVDHVSVSQDICKRGLRFIVPVLGNVSRVEGEFSVAIDGSSIPLNDLSSADIAGRVTIHSMEVEPGPLVQELHVLLGKPAPVQLAEESEVPFRMVQGRIYHQNMNLRFPELTVRTYGSVGLDESLALMAELPVPPKWLANNPSPGSLAGQTIQLPIGGTLQHPKIDPRALEQATAKFIGRAAENVLRNGIDNGLNKLLGR